MADDPCLRRVVVPGLTKKDGSFWLMDASEFDPNGPNRTDRPLRFRRLEMPKEAVAFAAGAAHGAGAGVHGPIAVAVTPGGEVWTWGLMLGDPLTLGDRLQSQAIKLAKRSATEARPVNPSPVIRPTPWRLPHVERNTTRNGGPCWRASSPFSVEVGTGEAP